MKLSGRSPRENGTKPLVAIYGTRGYPSFYGGFETAVRSLVPYFASSGWRVRVYGRHGLPGQVTADNGPDVQVVTTASLNSKSFSTLSSGLTSVVHSMFHRPDVALVMNVANGFFLPLLRLRGVPVLVNVDGIEWERAKWNRVGKFVFRAGARMTAKFANEIIVDSEEIGRYWLEHFGRAGIFIPYGADGNVGKGVATEFDGKRFVLLVARFVPENSVDLFLRAAPQIVERCNIDVVLVGEAPVGHELQLKAEEVASSNSRVHLLGHISDDSRLFALWRMASVYFHGHTVGGTNPALVQAMALGSTVVARDTVYNREVLGDAGVFCSDEPNDVVEAVSRVLEDGRYYSRKARDRVVDRYTWASVNSLYGKSISDAYLASSRSAERQSSRRRQGPARPEK